MDAPTWNGEPGALPSDPEWDTQTEREDEPSPCSDCGATDEVRHSIGVTAKRLCASCYRWRSGHGVLFDPRGKAQLEAAMRKGAA